jgi:NADH:ubiquinone oxidoreductase subunit F (NADH-binding)/NADH:ubiquinone oxidoreductase subunit E/Pyruvate/2-oxoacid:ferredoxin oxidoreductase delta subunit
MSVREEHMQTAVDGILEKRGTSPGAVIPILQDIQQEFGYLPDEALMRVTRHTEISESTIEGVASFYSQFRRKRTGEHIISVCTGTACHVKGALQVYEAIRREMKLTGEEDTDVSGIFTLEKVACLGCCTLAPVVRIDDVTYGHVLPEKAADILADFLKRGKRRVEAGPTRGATSAVKGEIRIGLGSCCIASGSREVKDELDRTVAEAGLQVEVKQVGCVGICNQVPILEIVKPGENTAFYARIKPGEVKDVVLGHFRPEGTYRKLRSKVYGLFDHLMADEEPRSVQRYLFEQRDTPLSGFLGPQMNIATENRGILNPCDLEEYRRAGGFEALRHCLENLSPQEVIDEIMKAGLRGRGGAGFPSGRKWQLVHDQVSDEKYIICNGDEGDPGAFMDRMLLESYPYRIIEGMLIAAYAVGATRGIFYIRAEYPLALQRITEAIQVVNEQWSVVGGQWLVDSGHHPPATLTIFAGAGAFVCGEETALIASIEGKRGIPKLRPPYPALSGLDGKPSLINNVETFSLVSWIIRNGSAAFSNIGTEGSKGTKVFALAGKVKRGGLIEVPMGVSIRSIVEDIGGGVTDGRSFKAVQIGGPSGGCIPASMSGLTIDYEALAKAGAMMGSGGLVVLDDRDCMVDIARYFLAFTQNQSCGQCTFCRVGTRRMLELLDKIIVGKGAPEDLEKLEKLAHSTAAGSLCGLGRTAPNPVLSTLKYFREEYEAHLNGACPAGKCQPLIRYRVNEKCIGCTKCAQRCPSEAIPFRPYEPHEINQELCIKCDICRHVCPVEAIEASSEVAK